MLVRARFVIYLFGCMQVNGMTATRLHTCVLIIFGILHSLALSGWPSTSPQSSYIHKSVKKEIKNLLHLLKRCTARKMYFMFDNIQVIQMKHVRLWMIDQPGGGLYAFITKIDTCCHSTGRDLYRATRAGMQGLGFCALIQGTARSFRLVRQTGDTEDLFTLFLLDYKGDLSQRKEGWYCCYMYVSVSFA